MNKEVERPADVIGIFPNEESIIRLIGAVLMEANARFAVLPLERLMRSRSPMVGPAR